MCSVPIIRSTCAERSRAGRDRLTARAIPRSTGHGGGHHHAFLGSTTDRPETDRAVDGAGGGCPSAGCRRQWVGDREVRWEAGNPSYAGSNPARPSISRLVDATTCRFGGFDPDPCQEPGRVAGGAPCVFERFYQQAVGGLEPTALWHSLRTMANQDMTVASRLLTAPPCRSAPSQPHRGCGQRASSSPSSSSRRVAATSPVPRVGL